MDRVMNFHIPQVAPLNKNQRIHPSFRGYSFCVFTLIFNFGCVRAINKRYEEIYFVKRSNFFFKAAQISRGPAYRTKRQATFMVIRKT